VFDTRVRIRVHVSESGHFSVTCLEVGPDLLDLPQYDHALASPEPSHSQPHGQSSWCASNPEASAGGMPPPPRLGGHMSSYLPAPPSLGAHHAEDSSMVSMAPYSYSLGPSASQGPSSSYCSSVAGGQGQPDLGWSSATGSGGHSSSSGSSPHPHSYSGHGGVGMVAVKPEPPPGREPEYVTLALIARSEMTAKANMVAEEIGRSYGHSQGDWSYSSHSQSQSHSGVTEHSSYYGSTQGSYAAAPGSYISAPAPAPPQRPASVGATDTAPAAEGPDPGSFDLADIHLSGYDL
jgi:hypothetical protein